IGRTVWVNGTPTTLIGVMPDAFTYPRLNIDLWRPFDLATADPARTIQMIVRARGDVPRPMFEARFASLSPAMTALSTNDPSDGRGWLPRPLDAAQIPAQSRESLWVLAAATALLLLTAGANLSSLTMAQIAGRTRQMAIQSALGASRGRL